MTGTYTYPGVYVEEIPSGVRTITGVSTSVTAFVGFLKRGPLDKAIQIFNMGDFEREFGGLDKDSELSYAVQQFFKNGGAEAWIIRSASGDPKYAQVLVMDSPGGSDVLEIKAASPGIWGNNIRVDVDYDSKKPKLFYNLMVTEYIEQDGKLKVSRTETFRNLSPDSTSSRYAVDVVNDGSSLVQLSFPSGGTASRPAQTGTVGGDLSALDPTTLDKTHQVDVTFNSTTGSFSLEKDVTSLAELRSTLESQLRKISGLEKAIVELIDSHLRVRVLGGDPDAIITFADQSSETLAQDLGLDSGPANVQHYYLGNGATAGAQKSPIKGTDGNAPGADELRGSKAQKTGLYALEDVDIFNILCIPITTTMTDTTKYSMVVSEALSYCEERRAFFIVDIPKTIKQVQEIKDWMDDNATLRHKNAAVYFPLVKIADPKNDYRLRTAGISGTLAGLYARTDSTRGIWKAPAGTEAVLRGIQALDYKLTAPENGTLNPLGINCLRILPVYGTISWGARTLVGSDQQASEWKYIPVRRLALFLEESLYRGLQWVVFEPNDEPLWAQIRLNVGAFMHDLFRQGAFQGTTPRDAYFVQCDKETTTQNDIDKGIVNIVVGFAPLKPAEFVVIKIQQIAGQIQS